MTRMSDHLGSVHFVGPVGRWQDDPSTGWGEDEPDAESRESSGVLSGRVVKIDEDRRLVWGWASVIEEDGQPVVDKQGDVIDEDTLVEAAHAFVADCRRAKAMHAGEQVGELVESTVLTKDVQEVLGVDIGKVGWWVCFKVHDDDAWARVKSGELRAFSIGGSGTREDVEG